jgi:hypothetical protein
MPVSKNVPAGMYSGAVLQVVNATYSTQIGNATATYQDTGLTATITPTSATSKILVCVQQNGVAKTTNASSYCAIQLLRNATVLTLLSNSAGYNASSNPNYVGTVGCDYLDSPATTSAVTYKTQLRSPSGTVAVYAQVDNETSTITLMEIAA